MKTKELFKLTLLVLMALLGTLTASAAITYDFSAPNEAGQIIYYNILDEDAQTVELAYAYDTDGYGHNVYNGYGDMVIPSTVEYNGKTYTVTHVRRFSFYRADITSVSLPNTIDSIGNRAFATCMNLSSFTVPKNVKRLGGGMLSGESGRSNVNQLYYNAKYADGGRWNANCGPFYLDDCEVIIGEEVEHLPDNFLRLCNIKSITIPSNVTSIGEYAFYNCRHLGPNVIIPQNVTSIGISAFSGCDSLTTVIATMTTPPSIEDNVFPNRRSQTLYVPSGCLPNYVTADYWKEFKKIEEPTRIYFEDSNVEAICVQNWDTNGDGYLDQIEAYLVTDLGTTFQGNSQITKFNELQYFTGLKSVSANAFQGCTGLTEMTLPTSLKTIGNCAFMGCSHLVSVSNLNDISTIGESAFANCTNLTDLTVNAATIKSNAFQGCTGLTSATVSATTVESNAFNGCTGLNTATVTATTVESNAFHGCIRLAELTVRATTVAGDAFQGCTNLATVSFNANAVESNTFQGCTHLTSVTLGNKVADIKEGAFRNCTALTGINIPGTVITISGGFEGCTSLSNVTLNSGTKYIVNSVFQGCSSLRSITLPNGLLYIGESVFEGTGLSEINIPSSVTSIQSRAFYGCDNMTKVTVNWTTPLVVPADAFPNRANQWLIVPQGTKESYQAADVWKDFKWIREFGAQGIEFADANVEAICLEHWDLDRDGLIQLDEAAAVTSLMAYFRGNTEITSFDELRYFTGLANIPANAFNECTNLTSIMLPEGVTIIASYAFRGCSSLTSIVVPDGVTEIYGYVFQNCTSLNTVILPESLTSLGNGAFSGCSSLTDIDLPDGLTTIGQYVFSNCTSLNFMDIPSSVNSIGVSTFNGCTNLKAFGVHWTTPITVVASTFPNRANQALYVPEGTKATYQAADVWKDFKWILEPSDCEAYVIFNDADSTLTFYYDGLKPTRTGTAYSLNTGNTNPGWYNKRAGVAHVVIDASFGAVRPTTTYSWFNGMYNLKDFTSLDVLNTSEVTNMHWMFYGCKRLASLDLSHFDTSKVTDMGGMFNGCNILESLGVSHFNTQNVTDMSSMFYGCKLLTSLDVRNFDTQNVTTMNSMFSACNALSRLDVSGFNTAKVTNMASMFSGCNTLTSLDVTKLNTEKVTNMNAMFQSCSGLTSLDLTTFNTSLVTNMQGMFTSCTGLTELDLSSFDTHNVTNMYYMFGGGSVGTVPCANLVTVYVGNEWSTAAVTNSSGMFQGCTSLVGGKGTTYNASHVDKAYAHIDGGTSNPGYFTAAGQTALRGDVDGDGQVKISDVTALINYLLSGDASSINLQAADCDQDGNIKISDVTALINYLLSGSW